MRHVPDFKRVLSGLGVRNRYGFRLGLVIIAGAAFSQNVSASLQIAWESPTAAAPTVLKSYSIEELLQKKASLLTEVDPLSVSSSTPVKFSGPSLSVLVEETTKSLTAADRSTTDLVILKTRTGKEVLMPKAFLVKYPQIQIALKKNGESLGTEAPRVVLPATTNSKIRAENILLEPLFVAELSEITLTSYEKRYGAFFLKRRTDPAAMRGEKLFLQNCVSCHTQPQVAMSTLASTEKVERIAKGQHPDVPGVRDFRSLFDKKATRSLASYLEAFRFQTAKN